ncbi:hypothetical protein [Synechococcus sp. CS-1328]|uniref:hypothetical protein n=1 Tax=Synechococcus sp. CS-1328 TaxID=2847976 RepID=UPI00223BFC8D|nr:hypothetical protein [Synechococcus sp. CS-1328]MCT0225609.1 hypothetical protein [Synechococcus sp. CS-1328]
MVSSVVRYSPQDPVSLVESCQKALEWILRTHGAEGRPIRRCWIDQPYGEEELTLLEEEVLPVMAAFLERIDAIDQGLEARLQDEIAAQESQMSEGAGAG